MRQSRRPTLILVPAVLLALLLGGCSGGYGDGGYEEGDAAAAAGREVGPGSGILFVRAEVRGGVRVAGTEEIWVVNPDGSGETRLTNDRRRDSEPQWSPNGTRIVFVRQPVPGGGYPDLDSDVWVMNADGSGKRNLTQNEAEDFQPRWSPDGTQIVFTSDRDGDRDIFLMNADGSNVRNLTNHPAEDADPAFSPDGTKIAFRTGRVDGGLEIFVMNLDGSGLTNVSRDCCEPPCCGSFGPLWSPDGTRILFGSGRFGLADEEPIFLVVNADGSGLRLLDTEVQAARFTRDSSQIVYSSNADLRVINVDGSGRRSLGIGEFPLLSPDGRRIAIAGSDPESAGFPRGIFVVDLDGSNLTRLTGGPEDDVPADWR